MTLSRGFILFKGKSVLRAKISPPRKKSENESRLFRGHNYKYAHIISDMMVVPWLACVYCPEINLYIYFARLSVFSLYPINVKTALPIRPKIRVGPHMTTAKVYGCSKLQKFASKIFWIFVKF